MKNIIFRKIGGRIIPIMSRGQDGSIRAARMSAKKTMSIKRKAIKKKISARTSLSEKRIRAVRTVRKFFTKDAIKIRSPYGKTDIREVGNKIVKTNMPDADAFYKKTILGRFVSKQTMGNKAPETFLVKTSKRNYLVADKARGTVEDVLGGYKQTRKEKSFFLKAFDHAKKKGLDAHDMHGGNLGVYGKKLKVIDTDLFSIRAARSKRGFSASERKKMRKFIIKQRHK